VKSATRRPLVAAALLAVVLAAGAAWLWLPAGVPAGQQPLTILEAATVPDFVAAFDEAPAAAHLVLLVSPT